jgi:hypothetical protein
MKTLKNAIAPAAWILTAAGAACLLFAVPPQPRAAAPAGGGAREAPGWRPVARPAAALRATSDPEELDGKLARAIAADPAALIRKLLAAPPDGPDLVLEQAIALWVGAGGGADALDFALALPAAQISPVLGPVLFHLVQADPAAAGDLHERVAGHLAGQDGLLADLSRRMVWAAASSLPPADAVAWLQALPPALSGDPDAWQVLAAAGPAAEMLAALVGSGPPGEPAAAARGGVFARWSGEDPAAAATWLLANPGLVPAAEAAAAIALGAARLGDDAGAGAWLALIDEPQHRGITQALAATPAALPAGASPGE